MSGALSKRQQARNERALQDLIKTVPGNNVCADCQARNPGWASWSLGVFLCMRCAALHRKIGTHITKVKSLSMDSWSNEQVENMKRIGNVASNRTYNPQNTRPPVPIDADEADSAMERFIRRKYQDRGGAIQAPMRHNTGSTNSDDHPPPLPPKTGGSRFGFRSASSIFPLSSKARREAARQSEFESSRDRDRSPSPPRRNKPSRIFGTEVGSEGSDDLDSKMAKLRDMGFKDEKRNMAVLKGLGGNMEKAIEALVRLGDGSTSGGLSKSEERSEPARSRAPLAAPAGLSMRRSRELTPPKSSNNPFDMLDLPPAKPQSPQSTGTPQTLSPMTGNNPYQNSANSNPFGLMPSQSQYSLNQAFQGMSVSSSLPLFPNHTGGFPGPQQPQHHQLYQQSMTPPVPSIPQQYYPPVIYENPGQQSIQNTGYNPFIQPQPFQAPPIKTNFHSNPYAQQLGGGATQHLFSRPTENAPQEQQNIPAFYDNVVAQSPQQQLNPFFNQTNPYPQAAQASYDYQAQQLQQPQFSQQYRQQTHPLMSQQTGRADKRSILDLYNYPQLAPAPLPQHQDPNPNILAAIAPSETQRQQRSVSSPATTQLAGSRNPFISTGGGSLHSQVGDSGSATGQLGMIQNGSRHATQESISIDSGGWQNGRHSPDAWGTISGSMR